MVPTKTTRPAPISVASKRMISTRSNNNNNNNTQMITNILTDRTKRKAESPPPKGMPLKRSAFGNLTNALQKTAAINLNSGVQDVKQKKVQIVKKVTVQTKVLPTVKTVSRSKNNENIAPPPPQIEPVKKPLTRASLRGDVAPNQTAQKPKDVLKPENRIKTRLSNEFDKTDESLYTSASESLCDSIKTTRSKTQLVSPEYKSPAGDDNDNNTELKVDVDDDVDDDVNKLNAKVQFNIGSHDVPQNVNNFDKENWNDIYQVSHYAMDIFNYMKSREATFEIRPYMERQVCLTAWMRSLLIDWMVEVQESFELNHETLYLGVKLVDYYLSKVIVGKETLQLVGAASMFIASKYDERIPPLIDDFLYICDGAYTRRELIRMEMNVLKICDFNLGIPISYRFLRRYARCAKVSMPVLTLARYILEYSLMDYAIITISDSKLAAAALYLALRMKNISSWTETLEFYTGYKLVQFIGVAVTLNNILHKKPKEQLSTVRNKYSHKIFFEVAKTMLIANEKLLNIVE